MKSLGVIATLLGAAVGIYAFAVYDPTIGDVYNIGKLDFRRNLVILAGVLCIAGVLIALFSSDDANSKLTNTNNRDEFYQAIKAGNLDRMEQYLKSRKIDPNGRNAGEKSCWLRTALNGLGLAQTELLLAYGADPKLSDGFGNSVLDTYKYHSRKAAPEIAAIVSLLENPPPSKICLQIPIEGAPMQSEETITIADGLSKLAALKDSGHLSEAEYRLAKAKLMGA